MTSHSFLVNICFCLSSVICSQSRGYSAQKSSHSERTTKTSLAIPAVLSVSSPTPQKKKKKVQNVFSEQTSVPLHCQPNCRRTNPGRRTEGQQSKPERDGTYLEPRCARSRSRHHARKGQASGQRPNAFFLLPHRYARRVEQLPTTLPLRATALRALTSSLGSMQLFFFFFF